MSRDVGHVWLCATGYLLTYWRHSPVRRKPRQTQRCTNRKISADNDTVTTRNTAYWHIANRGVVLRLTDPPHYPKPQLRRFTHFRTANSQLVTMERPHYPIPWIDPHTQLPDLPSQTASISDQPFYHRPTDGWRERSMTKDRFRSIESDDAASQAAQ